MHWIYFSYFLWNHPLKQKLDSGGPFKKIFKQTGKQTNGRSVTFFSRLLDPVSNGFKDASKRCRIQCCTVTYCSSSVMCLTKLLSNIVGKNAKKKKNSINKSLRCPKLPLPSPQWPLISLIPMC